MKKTILLSILTALCLSASTITALKTPQICAKGEEIQCVSQQKDNLNIRAKSAYSMEYTSGTPIYTLNETAHLPIASMCKIMTLVLCFDAIKSGNLTFDEEIQISENAKKDIIACVRGKNTHDLLAICKKCGVDEEKAELLAKLAGISGNIEKVLPELTALACNDEMKKACAELEFVASSLKKNDVSSKLCIDLSVVNNTEYYNGIIFQGYVEKAPVAVLSGGRYDKLASKLRNNTQAIGFAVYLDNLNLYYRKQRDFDSDILILFDSADESVNLLSLVESFVDKGFSVRVEHTVPEGYKAKTVYSYENGALREVSSC